MLVVENLTKKYGEYYAVRNLSFTVDSPGVYALLGTNGAGKTTAIRMLLGMLACDVGSVSWLGKPLSAVDDNVGYLAEERGLYPRYNVVEQLTYFARLRGMSRRDALSAIDYWFTRLCIDEHKKKRADQLSKGNQQKVQFACSLISDPDVIVLDEPLSGLDPVNSDLFSGVIRELIKRDKYVIMSSHQMSTVEEFCENITILYRGNTVLQGNLADIKAKSGRNRLSVRCEHMNIMSFASNMKVLSHTPVQTDFEVKDENDAHELLRELVKNGLNVIKFELREPNLHEIFVNVIAENGGVNVS
ncbi:ABC transporter ATP-binding protein [Clostridia bacterium]|nr:ABC transporter ATP-binding protein [Clostridia bacterium]